MLNSVMKKALVCVVTLLVVSSVTLPYNVNPSLQQTDLESQPNCTCYNETKSLSCLCDGNIYIHVKDGRLPLRLVFMNITLICTNRSAIDPYRYLSHLNLQENTILVFRVEGCPPPEGAYSSLLVRRGGKEMEMGSAAKIFRLEILCGNMTTFPLQQIHLSNLYQLAYLEIDCPALVNIPDDLLSGIYRRVSTIQICNTALTSIPNGLLSQFINLQMLILSGNNVTSIDFTQGMRNLHFFYITKTNAEYISDDSFRDMNDIQVIGIHDNQLKRIPDNICELKSLKRLFAQNNRIQFVKEGCFASLTSLINLKVFGNGLTSLDSLIALGNSFIPPTYLGEKGLEEYENAISSSSNASADVSLTTYNSTDENIASPLNIDDSLPINYGTTLDFNLNNLTSINERAFFSFTNLTVLDLSHNRLDFLPPKLFLRNRFLTTLRLSNNFFTDIPENLLSNSKHLEHLDLSSNKIVTLAKNMFFNVPSLSYLSLSNNSIASLPYEIFLPFTQTNDSEIPLILNLEGNQLTTLPNLKINRLTELNLARNRIKFLPFDTLHEAYSLQRLNLSFNYINVTQNTYTDRKITSSNDTLFHGGLKKIYSIDLSHNQLTDEPFIKFVEESLLFLNLSGNRMSDIPFRISALISTFLLLVESSKFNTKWMSDDDILFSGFSNSLLKLRKDFVHTKMLTYVDLSWNDISIKEKRKNHYPTQDFENSEFLNGGLWRLEVLILSHNNIEVMPYYFESMPKLRYVDLSYNKFKRISQEHLFYVRGVRKYVLNLLGDSENSYVKRDEDFFELPNSHSLTIDLRNNEIAAVELPDDKMQIVPRGCEVDREFSRATLLLGHNPIICSCNIFNLLRYAQKELRPVAKSEAWAGEKYVLPVKIDIEELSCWEPLSMRGKDVSGPETWAHHLLPLVGLCHVQGDPEEPLP